MVVGRASVGLRPGHRARVPPAFPDGPAAARFPCANRSASARPAAAARQAIVIEPPATAAWTAAGPIRLATSPRCRPGVGLSPTLEGQMVATVLRPCLTLSLPAPPGRTAQFANEAGADLFLSCRGRQPSPLPRSWLLPLRQRQRTRPRSRGSGPVFSRVNWSIRTGMRDCQPPRARGLAADDPCPARAHRVRLPPQQGPLPGQAFDPTFTGPGRRTHPPSP